MPVVCTLDLYQTEEGFIYLSHHFAENNLRKVYVDLAWYGPERESCYLAVVMIVYFPFLLIPNILIKMW